MLMSDPVILTTSNNVVDKSTICRHLLRYVLDLEKSEINVCSGTILSLKVSLGVRGHIIKILNLKTQKCEMLRWHFINQC